MLVLVLVLVYWHGRAYSESVHLPTLPWYYSSVYERSRKLDVPHPLEYTVNSRAPRRGTGSLVWQNTRARLVALTIIQGRGEYHNQSVQRES